MALTVAESSDTLGRLAEVARELTRRRADLVPHARGSLEQHLLGVHEVLGRWRQPLRVKLAGLLHSAYSTEAYGTRLFERAERARVRELVGVDAERLVFAFCACKREALSAAIEDEGSGGVSVPARWKGVTVHLERRELADLMVIHAANLAEQICLPRGGPTRWLALASRLLRAARPFVEALPPVLDRGKTTMTRDEETSLLRAYRLLLPRSAAGERRTCKAPLSSPVGEPLVVSGVLALAAGHGEEAAALGERALIALDAWGIAWDKRLRLDRWKELAALLVRDGRTSDRELDVAARRARVAVEWARGSPQKLWTQLDALQALPEPRKAASSIASPAATTTGDAIPSRFARYIVGLRANAERPMLQFFPGLRARPWHDPRKFAIVRDLERLAPQIAAEAKGFDAARFQDEAEDIERTGRWGVLFFLEMGRRHEDNLARCPTLRWIVEHHRTLTTHAGLMYLSCLDPGTRVAPHRGPTNVRLRCHLGLEVPDGCGIRIGGVSGRWDEGRCIVFDDSFEHDVWNDGDRRRVVLVLDLWHPDLSDDEVALLAGLHRYGATNGSSTRKYLGRNDAALRRAHAPGRTPAVENGHSAPLTPQALETLVSAAMRAGDLELAGERAARYAELCRGTRWYPRANSTDPKPPPSVPWEPVLTPAKLLHDIQQLEYLQERGVLGEEFSSVIEKYDELLDTLRPLGDRARVPLRGAARAQVGHVYNRIVHVRRSPRVPRALSGAWSGPGVEDEYLQGRPSVVVVDDFLSREAIESLRLFCLESTVWSINRYDHGRLGSFFRDGFNCPLLIQIAEELRAALPRLIGARHPLTQMWGYKYAPVAAEPLSSRGLRGRERELLDHARRREPRPELRGARPVRRGRAQGLGLRDVQPRRRDDPEAPRGAGRALEVRLLPIQPGGHLRLRSLPRDPVGQVSQRLRGSAHQRHRALRRSPRSLSVEVAAMAAARTRRRADSTQ